LRLILLPSIQILFRDKLVVAAFLDVHNKLVTQVRQLQAKELPPAVAVKNAKAR
jgi:hypothetical protein